MSASKDFSLEELGNLSSLELQQLINSGELDVSPLLNLDPQQPNLTTNNVSQGHAAQQLLQGFMSAEQSPGTSTNRTVTRGPTGRAQTTPDGIYTEIVEQPKQRGLRFRYECEGRSAGSIPGEKSTQDRKSFPTIKIHQYQGVAVIVVSCVTKDHPYEPHPHNLVGKDCKRGVCTLKVKDTNVISFPHLGIQCAKKKDVMDNLKQRKEINVDPFQSGFKHMQKANNIDLNVVRLCFQVFLPDENGKITRIVPPVVSHPIHDKKSLNELVICRVDKSSGRAKGGDEVFLLCEKINKDDVRIRFYQENDNGDVVWEDSGDFSANDIHRQYAIVFKTPPYKDQYITRPEQVKMQLQRLNDPAETSDPIPFIYMPEDPDPDRIFEKRKRKADQLRSLGLLDNPSPDDIKQRLKIKATKSRIKQEKIDTPTVVDEIPFSNLGASSQFTTNTSSVRTSDNTGIGNMTINVDSLKAQLASLPETLQNQLLQRLAMQKLQQEMQMQQTSQSSQGFDLAAASSSGLVNAGLLNDIQMQPANTEQNTMNMIQQYLGDQGTSVSFESLELSGNLMNVEFDPNIGAMESVASDERQIDEANLAIHALNQS
ncbi:putative transcription factor p65 homolog isoform X2 [Mytilus californianus]|uniref:putative transcription factor p65 homolog isoform X2 n=1 Tax=Mytilus californianus TaxID=6549 RepID=UPI00224597DC|nr:putative transcription factor p65 homolog isoform X2 [Mytilus californianus]